jgi:hypothetical protein
VLRIRRTRSVEDQELIKSYEYESSEHETTSKKLDDERNEIIENLKKYATMLRSNKTDLADPLKQIRFFILEIRALLVSAEYFNHQIVQAVYFKVKDRLRKDRLTELHIFTDEFNDFDSDASIKELAKIDLDGYLNKDLKVAITKADKTEVRFSDISNEKSQPKIIFEDKKVRLVRT